jgi:acetolactate synthase-1/2/3 large subunit
MLGYPCTNTLMGLGAYPASNKNFFGYVGNARTVEANNAVQNWMFFGGWRPLTIA